MPRPLGFAGRAGQMTAPSARRTGRVRNRSRPFAYRHQAELLTECGKMACRGGLAQREIVQSNKAMLRQAAGNFSER
jgi:hypothetical protein